MKCLHIITPVKDSIDSTLETVKAIMESDILVPFTYTVYNDFSTEENTHRLEEAARYLGSPYRISGTLSPQGALEGVEPLKILPPPGEYRVSLRRVLPEPGDFASIPAIIEIREEPPVTIQPGQDCLCKALSGAPWQHAEVRAEFQ